MYSTNRTDGPWRYTVEAGKSLRETFDLDDDERRVHLQVFGPNGFVRKFAGNTQQSTAQNAQIAAGRGNNKPAEPEVKVQYDAANGNVFLKFSNKGSGIATSDGDGQRVRRASASGAGAGRRAYRRSVGAGVEPSLVRLDGDEP